MLMNVIIRCNETTTGIITMLSLSKNIRSLSLIKSNIAGVQFKNFLDSTQGIYKDKSSSRPGEKLK